jgi:hypothetical protein
MPDDTVTESPIAVKFKANEPLINVHFQNTIIEKFYAFQETPKFNTGFTTACQSSVSIGHLI